jgi:NADPH:quinone reductase-like Zn-dependent oxidoreductase
MFMGANICQPKQCGRSCSNGMGILKTYTSSMIARSPTPDAGQVVIRVGASSFNYHDVFTVKGMPGIKVPLPVIIGLDMAGEIVEVGEGVSGWSVGDRVLVTP